jgi:serine/threonine protein kinase
VTSSSASSSQQPVGSRYAIHDEIAAGGMATVHLGRLLGPVGFSKTVAIKKLHPHYAKDADFVSMFMDEARLAARVQHPNVVQTLDVVAGTTDLFLVMEYVQGETLSRLWRTAVNARDRITLSTVSGVIGGMLHGLHAVHEAKDEQGEPLNIVHRDISPQNVMVGVDGISRLLDFGVAKAVGRVQQTREGQLKGKIAYMAPELLIAGTVAVSRQTDIYAAGVVMWELLTGARLYDGESDALVFGRVLQGYIPSPSSLVPDIPTEVDEVVMRAVDRDPARRFATARDMALALEAAWRPAQPSEVGAWVEHLAHSALSKRAQQVAELESSSSVRIPRDGVIAPGSLSSIQRIQAVNPQEAVRLAQAKAQVALEEGIAASQALSHPSAPAAPDVKTRSWGPPGTSSSARLGAMTTGPFSSPGLPDTSGRSNASDAVAALPTSGKRFSKTVSVALLLAIAGAFFAFGTSRLRGSGPAAAPPPAPAVSSSPVVVAPPPVADAGIAAVRPAVAKTPDAIDPSTLPVAGGHPKGTRSGGRSNSAGSSSSGSKSAPSAASAPNCDPPFTRDESGVKVYKEECLK